MLEGQPACNTPGETYPSVQNGADDLCVALGGRNVQGSCVWAQETRCLWYQHHAPYSLDHTTPAQQQ